MMEKNIQRRIMGRMMARVLRNSVIYLILLVIILVTGNMLGHTIIWQGTEPAYFFLHWVSEHALSVGCFLFAVGEFVILFYYCRKLCGYLQLTGDAMERVYGEGQEWIVMPEELKELENRMNTMKQQLQQSRLQAKEAEQRKNDLVVYLAHDLKTPLTSVLGYLMLLEEAPDLPPEMRAKYIGISRSKAERLEELINEFFEITRFNLTTMELEKQSINFTRLLEQTIFEFQPMLKEKRLTCRLQAEKDIMLVCDRNKIQRVVDNLLRNGILYGYEGTELTVSVEEAEGEQNVVIFTCTNHGPTIPPEKLERIFEQFYRLDSARTSSTGGAGLGLAIAKEIVQLHGGSITAKSSEEVTVFIVTLPKYA